MKNMEDINSETIRKAAGGEIAAFEEIYRSFSSFVYNLAYRFLGNGVDAEDITQEVFIRVYRYLPGFGFRANFKTWLYRITVNAVLSRGRKKKRNREILGGEKDSFPGPPPRKPNLLAREEAREELKRRLSVLPARQRLCLILREAGGLSYAETARALKVKVNTVRTWLRRARRRLIEEREEKGKEK